MEQTTAHNQPNTWQTAAPEDQAVDPVALAAAYDEAARSNVVQSLLVARHGRLIGEQYFDRQDRMSACNIHSISKSVLSVLVGIAIHRGFIAGLDIPLAHWLPEYFGPHIDARKRTVTLRHLLTLTAGLGWIENETNSAHWRRSADWIAYALDLPLVALPGRQFNYNTTLTHLISVILTRATNLSTLAFARRYLFDALGIQIARWDTDPQGYHIGGSDLYLHPRDLLRFGQLVLDMGMVNSESIVPEQWLQESIRPHIQLRTPGFWHPAYKSYGYLWWLRKFQSYETAVASGYAGQLICIAPRLDLVIVTTATDSIPFASVMKQSHLIEAIVEDLIIPSVQEESDNGSSHSRVSERSPDESD